MSARRAEPRAVPSASGEPGPGERDSATESQRWMRDLGALLALPALWVDDSPAAIADNLLGVLTGMLGVDRAYARFADATSGVAVEAWRPVGPEPPAEHSAGPSVGIARMPLALPWGEGLVVVAADRHDFPTERELHLLRVAVGQAAISVHTACRLSLEQTARQRAEDAVAQRDEALRSLDGVIRPQLAVIEDRLAEATRLVASPTGTSSEGPAATPDASTEDLRHKGFAGPARRVAPNAVPAQLTRREAEVLGLLAQGLSNKEIAGVLWLSDRTVERHVTGLYRKIGVVRRSEATAFAVRHGIGGSASDRANEAD